MPYWATASLIGITLVGQLLGIAAMAGVVFVLFLVALRMEYGAPAYGADWPDQPRLPPQGRKALPGSRIDTIRPPTLRNRNGRMLPPPGRRSLPPR